jgi:hypothetical protein
VMNFIIFLSLPPESVDTLYLICIHTPCSFHLPVSGRRSYTDPYPFVHDIGDHSPILPLRTPSPTHIWTFPDWCSVFVLQHLRQLTLLSFPFLRQI